jgi:anti-sigma factor RsiW
MRCEMVKELLEAYIEGELDKNQQEEIKVHLADCKSCRQELTLTESIPRLVGFLPAPPVPEDIISDTLKQIHGMRSGWRGQVRAFGAFLSGRWRIVAVVCALLVVFLMGITYQRINNGPKISPAEVASAADDLRFALGIVGAATHNVQTATLTTGVSALSTARNTSEDAVRAVARKQLEVSDKLWRNLSILAQIQFQEVEEP